MGILGGLFGRSADRKSASSDRCMECGMTGGEHTDWCPTVAAVESTDALRTDKHDAPDANEAAPPA